MPRSDSFTFPNCFLCPVFNPISVFLTNNARSSTPTVVRRSMRAATMPVASFPALTCPPARQNATNTPTPPPFSRANTAPPSPADSTLCAPATAAAVLCRIWPPCPSTSSTTWWCPWPTTSNCPKACIFSPSAVPPPSTPSGSKATMIARRITNPPISTRMPSAKSATS